MWRHSPTGFEWGFSGSGPAQLALALLLDHTGARVLAEPYMPAFQFQGRHRSTLARQHVGAGSARDRRLALGGYGMAAAGSACGAHDPGDHRVTTQVVSVSDEAAPGLTVTVNGFAYLVLHLLPQLPGRPPAARVTRDPPCRLCEAPLAWRPGGWTCSGCRDTPSVEALAAWAAEHVADGAHAGKARREADRRHRRSDRWRAELGIPPDVLPTDAAFHAAAHVGDWRRAELLARIALQDGHRFSDAERAAWRERRDTARRGAAPP